MNKTCKVENKGRIRGDGVVVGDFANKGWAGPNQGREANTNERRRQSYPADASEVQENEECEGNVQGSAAGHQALAAWVLPSVQGFGNRLCQGLGMKKYSRSEDNRQAALDKA